MAFSKLSYLDKFIKMQIYVFLCYNTERTYIALSPLMQKGLVFESQPRETLVVKTGSDSSSTKCSAAGVSVTGPRK